MTTFRPVLQFRRALRTSLKMQYKPVSTSRSTKRQPTTPSPPSTPPPPSSPRSQIPRNLPAHTVVLRTLYVFILAHLFISHVGVVVNAEGPSMLPTLELLCGGLVISKRHRRGRGVRVGDLVTYDIPINEHAQGIKRVLGMPGDYVLVGTPAAVGDTAWPSGGNASGGDYSMMQVPPGHCWVVGDNLAVSRDSRHFGPLPLALVNGKVLAQMWPLSQFRIFKNPFDDTDGREMSPST